MKKYTAKELYAMEPQTTHKDVTEVLDHVPEVPTDWIDEEFNERVTIKELHYENYDGFRYWKLATVWFDDKPVMVIQNAGRGGRDHSDRYVTDLPVYIDMVCYLLKLYFKHDAYADSDLFSDNDAIEGLTNFYSASLDEYVKARESKSTTA